MAIAKVVSSKATPGTDGGSTSGINTTGANLLVAVVSWFNLTTATPTISDSKGNTWVKLTTKTIDFRAVAIWYVVNPTVGSGHTFTASGTGTYPSLYFAAFSGADTSSPFDTESAGATGGGSTIQPGSLTPAGDNELFVAGVIYDPSALSGINSSFTVDNSDTYVSLGNMGGALAYKIQTTGGAENPTWTYGGACTTAAVMAAFKAASGPSPATSYTFTGPSSGAVDVASTNFTVTPNGDATGITVTPASDGSGTFSPTSVTFSGSTPATFTYTPTSTSGSPHTLSVTDNGGLTDPSSIDYTVTAATISNTDQTAGRVYQRVAGGTTKTVTLAGTYSSQTPASIEVRIVNQSGGATVQDWTALSSPTIAGGNWSGSLSVPQGGWYNFLSRSKTAGGTVIATSSQTSNKWGVGVLVALLGQSNMENMIGTSSGPPSSSDLTRMYTSSWAVVVGNGAIRLANQLQATINLPVGLLPFGVANTSIAGWASGSTYDDFATALSAVGGDCEFVLWHQGERDMQDLTSYATYKTALGTLYSRVRTSTGRNTTTLKFGCAIVGKLDTSLDSTDASCHAIRSAQQDWIDETTGAFFAGSSVDLPLIDLAHWSAASYERIGRRYAQAILYQLGLVAFGAEGPRITSARRAAGSAVMKLTLVQDGGTALEEPDGSTDGGSLTGFLVSDDDFATTLTISSTAFSGNEVHLTLSAAPADGDVVEVHYHYGEDPDVTNPVYDDTAPGGDSLGLPLQPTTDPIAVQLVLTARSGGAWAPGFAG